MSEASALLREGVAIFDSGLAAQRAIAEGRPAREVALTWFKREMNLAVPASPQLPRDAPALSLFHTTAMAAVGAFAILIVIVYLRRSRRVAALLQQLANQGAGAIRAGPPSAAPDAGLPPQAPPVRQTPAPSTSFHATIGDCRGCHVEHLGIARRPTVMQHDALVDIAERQRAQPAPVFGKIGDVLPAMAALFHGATERSDMLDCVVCHANEDRHRTLFGRNCGDCHSTVKWTIAEFRHPSPRSTDCAQCHQAPPSHYMGHFRMVSMVVARQMHAQVDQCFLCHQITAWNDIKGVGWYKHH